MKMLFKVKAATKREPVKNDKSTIRRVLISFVLDGKGGISPFGTLIALGLLIAPSLHSWGRETLL
jgi:hypothetical protein